jgi:serine protease Do
VTRRNAGFIGRSILLLGLGLAGGPEGLVVPALARGDDTPGSILDAFEREMILVARRSEPYVVYVEARLLAPAPGAGSTRRSGAAGATVRGEGAPLKRRIGSGIPIDANGTILTTASLVDRAGSIIVQFGDAPGVPARLIGLDRRTNVALLSAPTLRTTPARLGESSLVTPGSRVIVVGSRPVDNPLSSFGCIELDRGLIWGYSEVEMLQLNAPVYRGHVGAPVVNSEGRVVAMVCGTLDANSISQRGDGSTGVSGYIYEDRIIPRGGTDVSFAIPIEKAQEIAAELKDHGRVDRGFMGVRVRRGEAPPGAKDGVSVQEVLPGGPADRVGIQVGDLILDYAGQAVRVGDDVTFLVMATRPGSHVPVTIERAGKRLTLDVAIGLAPNQYPAGAEPLPSEALMGGGPAEADSPASRRP